MTGSGKFIEVQGTGEEATFTRDAARRRCSTSGRPASGTSRSCKSRRSARRGRSGRIAATVRRPPVARILLAVLALGFASRLTAAEKPNVVLIVADDLGWADLGCYGSKYHQTPNLDRLAPAGLRFTQAYAACPVCSPTRAAHPDRQVPGRGSASPTGSPAARTGPTRSCCGRRSSTQLPLEEVTLADAPQGGRLRHRPHRQVAPRRQGLRARQQQGFDVNVAGDHTGTPLQLLRPVPATGRPGHAGAGGGPRRAST